MALKCGAAAALRQGLFRPARSSTLRRPCCGTLLSARTLPYLTSSQRLFAAAASSEAAGLPRKLGTLSIVSPYNSQHLIYALQLGTFSEKDLDAAFDRIDTDQNGQISVDEVSAVFTEWARERSLGEHEVEKMVGAFVKKWDDDGSGGISKEEFRRNAFALGEQVHPAIYQLAGCIFLMCVPFGIIIPYEPQLVASLNITAAQFGLAQGAMFILKFIVNVPVVDIIDRVGSKPILVGSTALLGASLGGLSLVSSLEHLMVCRAIGGVAVAGLAAAIQAAAVVAQTPLNRARSSAPFTQAMNAGVALGPAIGGLLSGLCSMETVFAGTGCLFLLSAVANQAIYSEIAPARGSTGSYNPVRLFSHAFGSWIAVLRSSGEVRVLCSMQAALWAAVAGTNMTLMPLLLTGEPLCFTASLIGALSAGVATLGVITIQPLAVFADRYGRRTALGFGTGVMGCSMAAVPFMGTPALVSGAIACSALGQNLLAPAIQALMIDTVSRQDPSRVTQAMSLLRSVQDVGLVSGATLMGAIGTELGYMAGYEVSSSLVLVMGLVAFLRLPPPAPRAKVEG